MSVVELDAPTRYQHSIFRVAIPRYLLINCLIWCSSRCGPLATSMRFGLFAFKNAGSQNSSKETVNALYQAPKITIMYTSIVSFKFTFEHPVAMEQDQFHQRGYVLLIYIFYIFIYLYLSKLLSNTSNRTLKNNDKWFKNFIVIQKCKIIQF